MEKNSQEQALEIHIEEYKMLNERVLTRANHHQNSINFSVILTVALFALLATIYKDSFKINSFILLCLPFPFYALYFHYLFVTIRINHYRKYSKMLHDRISDIFQIQGEFWQLDKYLKEQEKGFVKFIHKSSFLFTLISFFLLPPVIIILVQQDIGTNCQNKCICTILIILHLLIIVVGGILSLIKYSKLK
ncbi:MAG: hypothetical protein KAW56_12160 [Candidatus Marinimicrobia bacterium]|nr:hypothetical protein [Candidatus Neomarinimicrobiota bacterium]